MTYDIIYTVLNITFYGTIMKRKRAKDRMIICLDCDKKFHVGSVGIDSHCDLLNLCPQCYTKKYKRR